jgi:hypothetical protein
MKVVQASDLGRMVSEKGASVSATTPALRAIETALRQKNAPDALAAAVDRLSAAVAGQQEAQRATLGVVAAMLTQMRAESVASPAPIKAWDFKISHDDSEFKRITGIRATAIR